MRGGSLRGGSLAARAILVLVAACSGASAGSETGPGAAGKADKSAAEPGPAPPGFADVKAKPAVVTVGGEVQPYANVFVRRLPNTDAARFTFVRSATTTCETLPARGDELVAELTVSRYLTPAEDATHPSKRPLSVAAARLGRAPDATLAKPAPWSEPFIEPTTATVMFGTIDLALGDKGTIRGTVMAQVCPQEQAPSAEENPPGALSLTFEGVRLRVRGVVERGGEVVISTSPLACDGSASGDLDVTLTLDGGGLKGLRTSGWATEASAAYDGTRSAKRAGGALDLDLRGKVGGHPIELVGKAPVRPCTNKAR